MVDSDKFSLPQDISRTEIEAIAKAAAKEAVLETFTALGIDMSSPQAVIKAQQTFGFLYDWRSMCMIIRRQGLITITIAAVTAMIGAVVLLLATGGTGK